MSQIEEVRQAKTLHREVILAKPNVVGLGVGYRVTGARRTDELGIVVLVRQKVPLAGLSPEAVVPREVNGIRTDVVEVGEIRPLQSRTSRWRPAPGGVSVGHFKITAGTLGSVVYDRATGKRLILSNNHVFANSNDAEVGDPILQPGAADGGRVEADTIARLKRFVPILFNLAPPTCSLAKGYAELGNFLARITRSSHQMQVIRINPFASNVIDAAVACPVDEAAISNEALDIGVVDGTISATLGMSVRKSGRTTALTTGEILVLDATVSVNYGVERVATFEDQIVTSPMSRGGDSGSLLVAGEALKAVGLLFAGSDQATIYNPIQAVLDSLKIEIHNSSKSSKSTTQSAVEKAQAVKQAYQEWLMSKANVLGVGVGLRHVGGKRTDTVALVVMVKQKVPKALLDPQDVIPSEIEGVPVDVREVGKLEAY